MAKNKKGFILYADQKELFEQLPNDKAGELIKHIFSYVNDEEPTTDDLILKLAFTPIKQQLKRDLAKFEETKLKRSKAGKKSAEARRNKKEQEATNLTHVKSVEQTSTKPTVKDNVNDNDKVKVKVKDKDIINPSIEERINGFLKWFNKSLEIEIGRRGKFRSLDKTGINNYKKLLKAGYSKEDFKHSFKQMTLSKWAVDNNMLTPSHFLRNENFAKYLNSNLSKTNKPNMV